MLQEILPENIAHWLFFCIFSQMNSGNLYGMYHVHENVL